MSISRDKAKEDSITMLNALYQQIADTAESVVPLYDAIEDFFFQDVDYQNLCIMTQYQTGLYIGLMCRGSWLHSKTV